MIKIVDCIKYEEKIKVWALMDVAYGKNGYYIDNYAEYVNKVCLNAYIEAAYDENLLVGFIAYYANNNDTKMSYITQIVVIPSYQGKHVGSKLLEHCCVRSREKKMKKCRLEVYNNNQNAIKFYLKNNFKETAKASGNSIYMEKIL